jgi:spore coat polysaccharide biosynthesis protein SpsF
VLSRFVEVSESYAHDAFIRITGDCPLIMPELIDQMVTRFYELNVDYLSNTLRPTFPDGLDIEIVKYGVLSQLSSLNLSTKEKEHVTYGIYNRPEQFSISNFSNVRDCSAQRWTVDYQQDLDFVRRVFLEFQARETEFSYEEINELLRQNPNFELANSFFERNEKLQNEVNDG